MPDQPDPKPSWFEEYTHIEAVSKREVPTPNPKPNEEISKCVYLKIGIYQSVVPVPVDESSCTLSFGESLIFHFRDSGAKESNGTPIWGADAVDIPDLRDTRKELADSQRSLKVVRNEYQEGWERLVHVLGIEYPEDEAGAITVFGLGTAVKERITELKGQLATWKQFAQTMEETVDNVREAMGLESTHYLVLPEDVAECREERDKGRERIAELEEELASFRAASERLPDFSANESIANKRSLRRTRKGDK